MQLVGTLGLYLPAFCVSAYAVFAYTLLPLGVEVHPEMRLVFLTHKIGIYTHVFTSALALALGPFQFSNYLRHKFSRFHRWSGRVYLGVGILVGGLSGLYMSVFAFGGLAAKLGFASLALLWLYTGLKAFRAIRRGGVVEHRRWMVRNFALTLAAVTLRIYVPSAAIAGIPFELAYPFIAWFCWLPNLLVAELFANDAFNNYFKPKPFRGSV